MRRLAMVLGTGLLVLLVASLSMAGALDGVWTGGDGQSRWVVQFNPDGTFTRQVQSAGGAPYSEHGRYRVQGSLMEVQVPGQQAYVLQFQLQGAGTLLLYEDGKQLARLTRSASPLPRGRIAPAPPATPMAGQPLRSQTPYRKQSGGSIVFTRYELLKVKLPRYTQVVPTPKIYIMNSDGSNQRPFIYPPAFDRAETPNWSPGFRWLLFSSNYQSARSAMYQDIFAMDPSSGAIKRLTGNEWSAGPVKGYGMIAGTVHDDTIHAREQMAGETSTLISPRSQIMITAQGTGGRVVRAKKTVAELKEDNPNWDPDMNLPIDPYKWLFVIPNVPAGKVWVKAWKSKHMGHMMVVDVQPGQVTKVDLTLSKGNYMVSQPSITADGRFLVAMSHHSYFYGARPSKGKYSIKPETNNAVVVADLSRPMSAPMIWNRANAMGVLADGRTSRGWMAKAPKLSPDGRTLALSAGLLETLENLATCSLVSLMQGHPRPKIVVPHRRVLASHQESNDWPSWSPDGRSLAFARTITAVGGNITANLFVVGADGRNPRQLTRVAPNQAVVWSSWSPDGSSIAFQMVTSKVARLNITDLATTNFTSDIYVVRADGSGLRRLTHDGRSAEPAWGP